MLSKIYFILFAFSAAFAYGQGLTDLRIHHDHIPRHPRPRLLAIEIEKHHVDVVVENGMAITKVEQVFRNRNGFILEGSYLFPIPQGASITDYSMVMNGRVVHAEVLEKDKARRIYEDIVRSMRDPALLEYYGRDLFKARVFPIPARGIVKIALTYVQELRQDGGVSEYEYPLKTQAFNKLPVGSIALQMKIKSARTIKSVFSSSHKIAKKRKSESEFLVSMEGKKALADRNFHLFFTTSNDGIGLHVLTEKNARDGGFFMVKLTPSLDVDPRKSAAKDVVFVVDISGSMQEDGKIDQAKKALIYGLRSLNKEDRFNVVTFSTEAASTSTTIMAADPIAIAKAITWVQGIRAAGGTNVDEALQVAFKSFHDDKRVKMVVLLTDGLPTIGETDESTILKHAKAWNVHQARLFVFGVGYDVNTRLLDLLAEEGRGARDYVTPSGNLELELSGFFDKIAYPVLTNATLLVDGIHLKSMHPRIVPDLFKGGEVTVFGRYEGSGVKAVRLKGELDGKETEFVFEGHFENETRGRDFIPTLWAKRRVGFLFDKIRFQGQKPELKNEIIRLGKHFGIATPYTSFLVTEDVHAQNRHPQAPSGSQGQGRHGGDFGHRDDDDEAISRSADLRRCALDKALRGFANGQKGSRRMSGKDAVLLSLEAKKLREQDTEDGLDTKNSVLPSRRIKGRSFQFEKGVWLAQGLKKADLAAIGKETVEVFSPAYFKYLTADPVLAEIVAELDSVLVRIDGCLVFFKKQAELAAKNPQPVAEGPQGK